MIKKLFFLQIVAEIYINTQYQNEKSNNNSSFHIYKPEVCQSLRIKSINGDYKVYIIWVILKVWIN